VVLRTEHEIGGMVIFYYKGSLVCDEQSNYINVYTKPILVAASSKRGSTATRVLELWVRILQGAWTSLSCEC